LIRDINLCSAFAGFIFFPPGSGSFKQHKETDLDGEGQKTNLNFVPKEYVGKGNPGVWKLC
jgi:hypothetical protein